MWGEKYQIIVTTHLDKDHIHNHFAFNSVSFLDGKNTTIPKQTEKRLRDVSDRILPGTRIVGYQKTAKAPIKTGMA